MDDVDVVASRSFNAKAARALAGAPAPGRGSGRGSGSGRLPATLLTACLIAESWSALREEDFAVAAPLGARPRASRTPRTIGSTAGPTIGIDLIVASMSIPRRSAEKNKC